MATLLSYALCSVADVTSTPGFPSGIDNDYVIRKINQATEMIERFTGRRFKETTYTDEEYDATNSNQLILKQRPITSSVSLGIRDSSLNENDWETVDAERYFSDNNAGLLELSFNAGGSWNRYRVTYTAGYSTIPADLAEAAATLAAFLVSNPTGGTNVRRKQEGQRELEYFNTETTGTADSALFRQLGIYGTLLAYANYPVLG